MEAIGSNSGKRTGQEWLSSLPACLLLLAVVLFSTSSDIHNRILKIGQSSWDGYYELRYDPVQPECDRNPDIDGEIKRRMEASQDDGLGLDLFEAEPLDPDMLRQSLENAQKACESKFDKYEATAGRITPGVKMFRAVELFIGDVIAFGLSSQRFILVMLVIICAATATFTRHHIALRGIETVMDHRVSAALQTVANLMLFISAWSFRELAGQDGAEIPLSKDLLNWGWITGFALVTLISGYHLIRIPKDLEPGGTFGKAMLSVPLYTTMCLISSAYFMSAGHVAGVGIYLDKMMDLSDMFLNVGLYVWVGMLLKQSKLASLVFHVFKPWKMRPEVLAIVTLAVTALPTAYTGASGIFVIAAGAVIYHEMREAGARRQLAFAVTAMSGSLGVVLRPCLLVVIIAYLNREVTTDQLFGWGGKVFILTMVLFAAVALIMNRDPNHRMAPASEALPESLRRLKALVPYALIIVGVTLFYSLALDVKLDEFSAPRVLPVMMLAILVYEFFVYRKAPKMEDRRPLESSIRGATNDTTTHIGALLFLMGLSVSIGGVIERAELMQMFPTTFASVWTVMAMLVVILVIIGMVMDPYGAVILVSATIANVAYQNGVDPVHFWMVTLVAFELGYLSPPVALNQLLTRQVVGEKELRLAELDAKGGTFYERHERELMPVIVMGTALILVAFVPLMVGYN
jgi:TRAP-type C4-dicarboxylate transport system permease large subunit